MRMLDRRMQLLLDERRYRRVARLAEREGVSVAEVIRRAIDALPDEPDRRRDAIEAILAAPRVALPADPGQLRRELDEARGGDPW